MSYEDYSFIGGSIVSYKQQQKIDQDLKEFEMSLKDKKKKPKARNCNHKQQTKPIPNMKNDDMNVSHSSLGDSRNFAYTHLLTRIFNKIDGGNTTTLTDRSITDRLSIPKPDVRFAGSKKTCYVNIVGTCRALRRDKAQQIQMLNHLKKFIETELITNSNFNGEKQLIIKGRWRESHIQSVLKSYVKSYILCEDCHSLNTRISKNNSTRLYELKCNDCLAERTCKRIEKAFKTIANKQQRIAMREREKEKRQKRNNDNNINGTD